jgi:hypothetical protein
MCEDQSARPKASQILQLFRSQQLGPERPYIGSCCQSTPNTLETGATQDHSATNSSYIVNSENDVINVNLEASPHQPSFPASLLPSAHNASDTMLPKNKTTLPSILKIDTHHDIGNVMVEDPASSSSLSLGRGSTTSGRRTSFGESSTRSRHLAKWSSGSVLSSRLSPTNSSLKCNCVPRTKAFRVLERLVLRMSNIALSIKAMQPTIETNASCGLHQNTLHLYESYSRPNIEKHRIWLKTRRLVVSHSTESSNEQLCRSFWIPLTDISFALEDNRLTLRWSDCNKWDVLPIGNNRQRCDCIYDSDNPNNEITLLFANAEEAVAFRDTLCVVYNEADGVREWRSVEIADQQTLLTVNVQNQDTIAYRLVCLTTHISSSTSIFQVFIHWPHLDLDIRILPEHEGAERAMAIRFDHVSTPHYLSDVVNEPWIVESKIARYKASELVFGAYLMKFPFGSSSSSTLPEGKYPLYQRSSNGRANQKGVEQTLQYLTDWKICFFAPDVKLTKVNKFSNTSYGLSDVILWERSSEDHTKNKREARITFRHRKSESNYLWRSGEGNLLLILYYFEALY